MTDNVVTLMRQLLIDAPALADLMKRVGTALESVGEAMEQDATGEVALLVNRMAGEAPSRYGAFPGFDVARWRNLTPERRHDVAEGWITACVEEERMLRVELLPESADWALLPEGA